MPSRLTPPLLLTPPSSPDRLPAWAAIITRELNRWFQQATTLLPDNRLIGSEAHQVVEDGFSVNPAAPFIMLHADGPVTSDAVAAIGQGVSGQWLVIHNHSAFTITIKNNAQTSLSGGDAALVSGAVLALLHWDTDSRRWVN